MAYYTNEDCSRSRARNLCIANAGYNPIHICRVIGGWVCFETEDDYQVYKNQK